MDKGSTPSFVVNPSDEGCAPLLSRFTVFYFQTGKLRTFKANNKHKGAFEKRSVSRRRLDSDFRAFRSQPLVLGFVVYVLRFYSGGEDEPAGNLGSLWPKPWLTLR